MFRFVCQLCKGEEMPYVHTYNKSRSQWKKLLMHGSILDHTLAKLLPVVKILCTHLDSLPKQEDQIPENFVVTEKFAPAQKNEKQLRFNKVKSKTKKTKAILM